MRGRVLALVALSFGAQAALGAEPRSIAENTLDILVDSAATSASAACQLMIVADLVAVALAVESTLTEIDPPADPVSVARPQQVVIRSTGVDRANATCEQPVGATRIVSGAEEGWGLPARSSGAQWGFLAPADDVSALSNRMTIDLQGLGTHAAVGCQLLVAVDAIVIANLVEPDPAPILPEIPSISLQEPAPNVARASCDQGITLLEIFLEG